MNYIGKTLLFLFANFLFYTCFAQSENPLHISLDTTYIGCDLAPVALNPTVYDISQQGLNYKYYSGTWNSLPDFDALSPVNSGTVSNLDISTRLDNNYFGYVFEGYIYLEASGDYTFYTSSDDGSSLYLNDVLLVNNDGLHGNRERSGTRYLNAGMHAVEVHFFEKSGGESLSWKYEGPNVFKQAVPDNILYYSDLSNLSFTWTGPAGFSSSELSPSVNTVGIYYLEVANPDTFAVDSVEVIMYEDPVFEAEGAWLHCGEDSVAINSSLKSHSYYNGLEYKYYTGTWNVLPDFSLLSPAFSGTVENYSLDDRTVEDNFAFVFEGLIYIDSSGSYTFYTQSDDGSKLFIEGSEIVNNDGLHGTQERSGTVRLEVGYHAIEVQFFEKTGYANLSVYYEGPGLTKKLIPDEALFYQDQNTYSYSWVGPNSFSDTLAEVFAREAGLYTLTITDDFTQCSAIDTAWVEEYCGDYNGLIFEDSNENGDFDEGELLFDSVKIELLDESLMLIDSTVSDSNGSFVFEYVRPGNYRFRLSEYPENMELLSGLTGYSMVEENGKSWITTPIQALSSGSSSSLKVPMVSAEILPVEYLDFQVNLENDYMTLQWTTAWEQNNQKFVVERSLDGHAFGVIGEVLSKGDSQESVSYRFVDEDQSLAQKVDLWYYRLRQIDLDGQFSLSPIVLARMESGNIPLEIVGYPNPISGPEMQIRYSGISTEGDLQLSVINALGIEMLSRELTSGEGNELSIDVANWPSGYYYLQIQSSGKQSVFKLQKI